MLHRRVGPAVSPAAAVFAHLVGMTTPPWTVFVLVIGGVVVVGLRGLEPLTSSLSARAGAAWTVVHCRVRAWILSMGVLPEHLVVGSVVQQLVQQRDRAHEGEDTGEPPNR